MPTSYAGPAEGVRDLRILVVDDRPLMRAGLASVLGADPVVAEVIEAGSVEAAYAILDSGEVDVVIASPEIHDPVETNRRFCALASRAGSARVICLSRGGATTPPACGRFTVLPESAAPTRFLTVVERSAPATGRSAPAAGRPACADGACGCRHTHMAPATELTAQESRVLAALSDGLSNREIATLLGLAEKTVKNHVTRIFTKLGVTSRTAAMLALREIVTGRPR